MRGDLALIDPARVAACAADEVIAHEQAWTRQHRRPRAFSMREAGELLKFETLLITTAALNVAHGVELSDADLDRLVEAQRNVDFLVDEAIR